MKKKFLLLLALCTMSIYSCKEDDKDETNYCLPCDFQFNYDAQGIPFSRAFKGKLTAEEQKNIPQQVIGHGWRCTQAFEIMGSDVADEGYYETNNVYTPKTYLFDSTTEMRVCYASTTQPDIRHTEHRNIDFNTETGNIRQIFADGPHAIMGRINIFSIHRSASKWHMLVVEHLQSNGNEQTWGLCEYVQMTDEEMQKLQEDYHLTSLPSAL